MMKLWSHQQAAVDLAKNLDHFALFFECGAGKTGTLIKILEEKYQKEGRILNTLILAPIVVLEQWEREFSKFSSISFKSIALLSGSSAKKQVLFNLHDRQNKNFIAITGYESLNNEGLMKSFMRWAEVIVCDESSRIKNPSAIRTKHSIKIAERCKYRYILSGTPILSSPLDIFTQFMVLDKGATFGKNFFIFRATYFVDKNAGWKARKGYFPDWKPKADCNEEISKKIAHCSLRVTKDEAIDLPELVKEKVYVPMGYEQGKVYKTMKDAFVAYLNDKACVARLAITKTLRLSQILSGFLMFDDGTVKDFEDVPRLLALQEILDDKARHHKIIVWAVFKRDYHNIIKICDKLALQYAELHGEVTNKDHEVQKFNTDDKCRVLIGHPGSGGIGVSLTAASHSIFYSRGFSMEFDVQAEARNYRGGSIELHKKVTRIDIVCKGTLDEAIMEAIDSKLQTSEEILALVKRKL